MRKRLHRYTRKYKLAQDIQRRRFRRIQNLNVRRFRRLRKHPLALPILLLLILLACFAIFVVSPSGKSITDTSSRIVIISHDGTQEVVPTHEKTVGSLLTKLNIRLSSGDVVQPALTTPIDQEDFRINIYRAQPIEVVEGNFRTFTYSAATTPRSIAAQAGVTVYPEDYVSIQPTDNFVSEQAIGERVVIDPATPINVNLYGTPTVLRTHETTVGALLSEEHIVLGQGDSVVPDPSTPLTASSEVYLIHKGTQIVTVQQSIPDTIQTNEDSSLAYGTSAIVQQGSAGQEAITYQVNLENGVPVSRSEISTVVTQQPVTEIVNQGTNLSGIKGDMALAGIQPVDYQYADYIISHESGWCTTKLQGDIGVCPVSPPAYLPTDLGYGLCQATPGDKMASAGSDWETDPVTQLEWCNGYAVSRYGGWYPAYEHWLAYGNW